MALGASAKTSQDMGLENVFNLDGGFTTWRDACEPVETIERNARS